jgi:hypothetical protein
MTSAPTTEPRTIGSYALAASSRWAAMHGPYDRHMEFAAGPPSRWLLTHRESGDEIEVWADSVREEDGC